MMTILKFATRLALSRDRRQRWRQVSVVSAALLATFSICLGAGIVLAAHSSETRLSTRAPIPAGPDDVRMNIALRGFTLGSREVSIRWIVPVPGHEDDPGTIPPGLNSLPELGAAVASPGLLELGVTPQALGFAPSSSGTGTNGAIGDEGIGSRDELLLWARPSEGRSFGTDGIVLGLSRFATAADVAQARPDDHLSSAYPLPRTKEMTVLVIFFVVVPALVMAGLGARAQSEVRAERSEFLLRLGVRQRVVRSLLAMEGLFLGLTGAIAGAIGYAIVGPRIPAVPLSGTEVVPGDFAVSMEVCAALGLAVTLLIVTVSGAMRLVPSTRHRPARKVSRWRFVPLTIGLACIASVGSVGAGGSPVFVLGVLLLAASLPWATPAVSAALARRLKASPRGSIWLAAARVEYAPTQTSRVAALLSLVVYLGATSVAIYTGPLGATDDGTSSEDSSLGAYYVGWLGEHPGDLETLTDRFAAEDSSVVVLPVDSTSETTSGQPAVVVRNCTELAPIEAAIGGPACDASGRVTTNALEVLRETLHLDPVTGADAARYHGPAAPVLYAALVLAPHAISEVEIYHAGSFLPALNVVDLLESTVVWSPIAAWTAAGWFISIALLSFAIVRELVERSRAVHRDGMRLARVGFDRHEAERVNRWTLYIPVMGSVLVSYVCGLITSFMGTGPDVTRYTPVWISIYTLVTLGFTFLAIAFGAFMTRQVRR